MISRPRREPGGLGLRPPARGIGARLRTIIGIGGPPSDATWDELEEALVAADMGATTALELVDATRAEVGGDASAAEIRGALAQQIRTRLERVGSGHFVLGPRPAVILVVGVNGTGKTTTIA
jgi:fused signal recognition particle receptor